MSIELDPDRNFWHFIVLEVRKYVAQSGESGATLARATKLSSATISRAISGTHPLSLKVARKLDSHWRTSGHFVRMVGFAQRADQEGTWFKGLQEHEALATHHRMWEALVVPGILQTSDYAQALLATGHDRPEDVGYHLETRLRRQREVFDKARPPQVSVILNWSILHHPVGGPAVMRNQLGYLLTLSEQPNVSIRVLEPSAAAHIGLGGSFRLLTVNDRDVAFEDSPAGGMLILDVVKVSERQVWYDRLSSVASPVGLSRTLITRAMESAE